MQGSLTERITRSLAYMLRHQPEEFDLELDNHGYAGVEDVTCALNERLGEPIKASDVEEAITSGDRPRYEIIEGRIRALYGHSVEIDPGEPSTPPELLFVGVGSRDAARASEHGLNGGRRSFLHLALDYEDARETGRRIAARYAIVTVYAQQAHGEGVKFYDRKALFLAEAIPTEYLEVGEVHDDGIERDRGFGGRGPRGRSGGRGRDGGGDRDRGRGSRDDRGSRDREPARDRADDRSTLRRQPAPRAPQAARAPERAPERAPAQREASKAPGSGFGSGIYSGAKEASRPEPVRSEPKKVQSAEPTPPASEKKDTDSGFGDGLF